MLDEQFADHYIKHGYAVIENAVTVEQLKPIVSAAGKIVDDFDVEKHRSVFSTLHQDKDRDRYFVESAEAVHCFLEEGALDSEGRLNRPKNQAINKFGHAMHDLVPEFAAFCRLPIFLTAMRAVGFAVPELWQTMYIFKQPKIGGEVRWHQDASYLIADDPGVVGVWVAMEDADRSNGCLWMQPGGQQSPLREIFEVTDAAPTGVLRQLDDTPWPDGSQAVPIEVSAGSLVVFDDRMPHYSSQNQSAKSRQAFTLHFTESGTAWSKLNWLQRRQLTPFVLS